MSKEHIIQFFKYANVMSTFTITDILSTVNARHSQVNSTIYHLRQRGIIEIVGVRKSRGRGKGRDEQEYRLTSFGRKWVGKKLGLIYV